MNNPFRNLEELQRHLDDLTLEIARAQFVHFRVPSSWQPSVNVFRCGEQFIVCVELAGVEKTAVQVRAEPRRVTIRGIRPLPEPSCDDPPAIQVLALEIDHGPFERVVDLPTDIDPERVTAEHRNGLLWIKLPLRWSG